MSDRLQHGDMTRSSEEPWKTREMTHEGFPLLLRCPLLIPYELQPQFPRLVALTHLLDEVTSAGLPVRTYNDRLGDFDHAAIQTFNRQDEGVTVLVETFAGKRTYYAYVALDFDVGAAVERLTATFPNVRLEHLVRENADWRFIRRYAVDCAF